MKNFNINNNVYVRLTDYGRKIHRNIYNAIAKEYAGKLPWAYKAPKEDKEGWSKWQLHDLMNIFGEFMVMGCELPFETTIRIEDPLSKSSMKRIAVQKGDKEMKTVYIASPYTKGDVAVNVCKSLETADKLLELGFIPYAPLLTHFWHLISPKPVYVWYALDNEWVKRCDCVLRLPGESTGADAEVELAKSLGIPVYFDIKELMNS